MPHGIALLLVATASCKPAAFAAHEADLMRSPPPALPAGGHAFWNDRSTNSYGEFILGPNSYRNDGRLCRTARVTEISDATHGAADRILLYCRDVGGPFVLDPTLTCRADTVGSGIICRNGQGDDITLPPA